MDRPQPPTSDTSTVETGDPTGPATISAQCTESADNPLRVVCEVATSEALPLQFRFGAETEDRTLEFAASDTQSFVITGLTEQTAYTFTAEADESATSGSFETGTISTPLPKLTVAGEATFGHVLFGADQALIIARTSGEVVWYETFDKQEPAPQKGMVGGAAWLRCACQTPSIEKLRTAAWRLHLVRCETTWAALAAGGAHSGAATPLAWAEAVSRRPFRRW